MNSLLISIGSNSRDRQWQMEHAILWLKKQLNGTKVSSIYNSEASNHCDPDYLNAVMYGECKHDLATITQKVKEYETICGRTPASKLTGNIPMDLDIVIWNGETIRSTDFNQAYFQKGWNEIKDSI